MGHITEASLKKLKATFAQATFEAESNTDERALEVQSLYPNWEDYEDGYTFLVGNRVNYLGVLYNVITEHQKQETWNPLDAPSLFSKVLIPNENVIPEWEQPDSTNAYMTGDKVIHNGITYVSLVDNNVWEPGAVGTETLWEVVV